MSSDPGNLPLKDSGTRQSFETGAVRDRSSGKGRYDLIDPEVLRRLALTMEKGAAKYSDRNWEKGIPLSRYYDSGLRHFHQWWQGQQDEDHLAQAFWNVHCAMHTERRIQSGELPQSLDDRPNYGLANLKEVVVPEEVCSFDILKTDQQARLNAAQLSWGVSGKLRHLEQSFTPYYVYVAGPYTAPTKEGVRSNIREAIRLGRILANYGHYVHVPHVATGPLPDEAYEWYMKVDLRMVERWATALYVIADSPGVKREVELAERLGLPIWRSLSDVPVHVPSLGFLAEEPLPGPDANEWFGLPSTLSPACGGGSHVQRGDDEEESIEPSGPPWIGSGKSNDPFRVIWQ